MSTLQVVPDMARPVVLGPANRCEAAPCTAQAIFTISNAFQCTSRRVCLKHAGDALLAEADEPGAPARLTVVRLSD